MGLHDRDYARAEDAGSRFSGPIRRGTGWRPSACWVLIFINLTVFTLWQITQGSRGMMEHFTISRANVFELHHFHTILTAGFSQPDMFSFLVGMVCLYFFGNILEEEWGGPRVVWALYLSGVIGCSVTHLMMSYLLHWRTFGLGSTGGILAFATVCAILFPRRIVYFFGVIPMPLAVLAAIYLVFDLLPLADQLRANSGVNGGFGVEGHLGGAIAGAIFYFAGFGPLLVNWRKMLSNWRAEGGLRGTMRRWFRRKPKLRLVKPLERVPEDSEKMPFPKPDLRIVESATPVEQASIDQSTSAKVDELLKKISRDGMNSLTPEERTFLESASKKYRK